MEKKYFYNDKTHRLHIFGYCKVSKILPDYTKFFATYDEALAYDGRSVGLCKNCKKVEDKGGMQK